MSVLVTGGAGYIGSLTVRALREVDRDVVVYDDLSSGHRDAVPEDVPLVVGRTDDDALVRETVARHGVTSCVHFAAKKAAGESVQQPARYFRENVSGSLALLTALEEEGVRQVVFSSSAAVYGTPERLPIDEDSPLHPESPYGETKAMVERILHWFDVAYGTRSVSLRYFNAAGAALDGSVGEDFSQTLNLIPLVMKALLGRSPALELYGTDYPTRDGTTIRDYVHVIDLADAHVKALEYLEGGGATTVVNLGTGVGSTIREVLDTTERVTGNRVPVVEKDRRAGDPTALYADNTRARSLLGWTPRLTLQDIIASAWAWHTAHPDGFAR
jgi:UDP-glucose-4-epimerase GalE